MDESEAPEMNEIQCSVEPTASAMLKLLATSQMFLFMVKLLATSKLEEKTCLL